MAERAPQVLVCYGSVNAGSRLRGQEPLEMITLGKRQRSPKTSTKTVLEIDLYSYNDIATFIEENLDVAAVRAFEDQIHRFVDYGLNAVGLRRDDVVLGTAGDNAVLIFDNATTMHRFAEAVH